MKIILKYITFISQKANTLNLKEKIKDTTQDTSLPTKRKFRGLRRLGRVFIGVILLFIMLVISIRTPWAQNYIITKAVNFVSSKTKTKIAIESLFLTIDGDIKLTGLYLEDTQKDTLIYSKSLEANLAILPLIMGNHVGIDGLDWEGVRAKVWRKDTIQGYNFNFLINAFTSKDTTTTKGVDSTKTKLKLFLRHLDLKDFELAFIDDVIGINSSAKFEALQLDLKELDLETMVFNAPKASITNAKINVIQGPSQLINTDTTSGVIPSFYVKNFNLKAVDVHYKSNTTNLDLNTNITDFNVENAKIILETNTYAIDDILLNNSTINLKRTQVVSTPSTTPSTFEWPDFTINIKNTHIENNTFNYFVNNNRVKKGVLNPNALALKDVTFIGNSISMNKGGLGLNLEKAKFKEGSGLHLKHLAFQSKLTDKKLSINKLAAQLNKDQLIGHLEMQYSELSAFFESPEQSKIDMMFSKFNFDLNDLFLFQPQLKTNTYLLALSKKKLSGNVKANGYISDIKIPSLNVFWGDSTKISVKGHIKNVIQTDSLKFNIPKYNIITQKSDIERFVTLKDSSLTIPDSLNLSGGISGSLKAISTISKLTTNQGVVTLVGDFENLETITFKSQINIESYELNTLLNNKNLGKLTATIETEGKGTTINNLNANIKAVINDFKLNNYTISNLEIGGKITDGKGNITSAYKDHNLDLNLNTLVTLDSITPEININLNLIGANLQTLGITKHNIKTAFKLNANLKNNDSSFDATATLNEGIVVYENKTYFLGDLIAKAHMRQDTTSLLVENKIININLQSNATPSQFSKALENHILSYFYQDNRNQVLDTLTHPVKLKLDAKLIKSPVINNAFITNLKDLDTVKLNINFNEANRKLIAKITAPHINYSDNTIDSLAFTMQTNADKFFFNLGFNKISAGPFLLPKTIISGEQINNELHLNFNAYNKKSTLIDVKTKLTSQDKSIHFHVIPEHLRLNEENWNIPEDNTVIFKKDFIEFNNFKFSKKNQSVEFTDKLKNIDRAHLSITYKNFQLNELLDYFNTETPLAQGDLNGVFIIQEPLKNSGVIADLSISNFKIEEVDLGTLNIQGKTLGSNNYSLSGDLTGGNIDLKILGEYKNDTDFSNLDINIDIEKFNMYALEGFTNGEISNTNGEFTGTFKINGTKENPIYYSKLNFKNAQFQITKLKSTFTLINEFIKIDNKGIFFNDLTIHDENSNTFDISGNIGTASFINPTFNLDLKAKDFQVLNASREDNDLLYGKIVFDTEAKITGDLEIPKIDMKLKVDSQTNVTYILPSATVDVEQTDGVVSFVNRKNPDNILTQTNTQITTFTGFDISSILQVGDDATLTIIINEKTNDNFKIFGKGDFNFGMKPNGQMNLSGIYNISGGHYEMSLYHLVNKRFELAPDSRVSWSGDPFDAKMDIRAIYNIETSASGLMATAASGLDISDKTQYQQVLPFNVFLNIDGELSAPKLSFNLDMPEADRGAANGQIYGRVQQINQEPDALNKQVFSLLVLNSFYPDYNSDGSEGGFNNVAKDNINSLLSSQLNMFSDKLLGNTGFDLDFGLNSFTDYQGNAATDRTNLDIAAQKKLFNERLVLKVGSEIPIEGTTDPNQSTQFAGNVSAEYSLTKDGRYKIKGFRKNEYENIIDGQTISNGIAIMFTQEFNKFKDLWEAMFKPTQMEVDENIKKKEKDSVPLNTKNKN